jgi:HSP20 family protein
VGLVRNFKIENMFLVRPKLDMDRLPSLFESIMSRDPEEMMNSVRRTKTLPAANVNESDDGYSVELALPGMKKADISMKVEEDLLTIFSESTNEKEEKSENSILREFNYSSFSRSFNLPDNINREDIKANYKNGVLTVSIPKLEEAKRKSFDIQIS